MSQVPFNMGTDPVPAAGSLEEQSWNVENGVADSLTAARAKLYPSKNSPRPIDGKKRLNEMQQI
jgi:hypothetical protein